jgi:hypothetical protein
MPWTLWTKWFLQAQGYTVNQNIFYQDNQSTMKLAQNGIMSTSEKTRHINIRYFFIKDTIKREKIDLQYCPTESMVADFFTKPLQGKLFKYLRNMIMGLTPLTLEERVEKHGKSKDKIEGEYVSAETSHPQVNTIKPRSTNESDPVQPCISYTDAVRKKLGRKASAVRKKQQLKLKDQLL